MKVSVIRPSSDEEDEIIFRCHTLDIYFKVHDYKY